MTKRARRRARELAQRAFLIEYQRRVWQLLELLDAGALKRDEIDRWVS